MSIAGAGSNIDPTFVDGVMFANDGEFYLYGSVLLISCTLQTRLLTEIFLTF
jgi:hypothetical protein